MLNKVVLEIVPGILEKRVIPVHPLKEIAHKSGSSSNTLKVNQAHKNILAQLQEFNKQYPKFQDFKFELKRTEAYSFYVVVGYIESQTGMNFNDYVTKSGEVYDIWELSAMELKLAIDDEKKYLKFSMSSKAQADQQMKLKIWQICAKMKQLVVFQSE